MEIPRGGGYVIWPDHPSTELKFGKGKSFSFYAIIRRFLFLEKGTPGMQNIESGKELSFPLFAIFS
jgi:hypothetical protein